MAQATPTRGEVQVGYPDGGGLHGQCRCTILGLSTPVFGGCKNRIGLYTSPRALRPPPIDAARRVTSVGAVSDSLPMIWGGINGNL